MEFFKKQTTIPFMRYGRTAMAISAVVLLCALAIVSIRGLNLGLDFTGGLLVEVGYEEPADLTKIRNQLQVAGFEGAVVQTFGSARDIMVRLAPREDVSQEMLTEEVVTALRADNTQLELRRQEFVGPQVGRDLVEQGLLAVIYTLIGILIYVSFRFEWRFAVTAVIALFHDVVITLGLFSLTGWSFDLTVLAAILAVIGYSLNDTIVVFDRVRENFRGMRKSTPSEIMDASINQTLSRSIMTSGTTSISVLALLVFGGEIMFGFAAALLIGILVGTYSSVYVAGALAVHFGVDRKDFLPPEKTEEIDDMP